MVLDPPDDADLDTLETLLTAKLDVPEEPDLGQSVHVVLLLAWRWRLPNLARQIFQRFARTKKTATIALNWAIMASPAHT